MGRRQVASLLVLALVCAAAPGAAQPVPQDRAAFLAKQTIDILGMIQDKTRGNLTQEEEQLLTNLLYDLRMKYVAARG